MTFFIGNSIFDLSLGVAYFIFENVLETELILTAQKCFNVSSRPELSFGTPKDLREINYLNHLFLRTPSLGRN